MIRFLTAFPKQTWKNGAKFFKLQSNSILAIRGQTLLLTVSAGKLADNFEQKSTLILVFPFIPLRVFALYSSTKNR